MWNFTKRLTKIALAACLLLACENKNQTEKTSVQLTSYVNPFVGTDGPGNTYPGATVPHGMVQLSPDNGIGGWDRIAGYYWQDSTIAGFSHTHLSGTGAGDMYDILVMPFNSRSNRTITQKQKREVSLFSHKKEKAEPGYYQVDLLDYGIKAELTATERVGIHRYLFPKDKDSRILINLGYAMNWDGSTDTYFRIVDNQTIEGYRYSSGWARDQREHFVAKFSKPFSSHQFFDFSSKEYKDIPKAGKEIRAKRSKVYLTFDTPKATEIVVKVALSSASIEGARKNMEAEAQGFAFNSFRKKASGLWEEKLAAIEVETPDDEHKKVFYTAMYHTFLGPVTHSDVDGQYKGANGKTEKAEGFKRYDTFSLWDTFRASHPLFTILEPSETNDMIRSMIAHCDEAGVLPIWSMKGNETNMMIGYHAVPVIADAYLKGLRNFDAEKAFQAMKKSAMADINNLDQYKAMGYIPSSKGHENWSVSKTLEYAFDDWCIAQMAKEMGKTADYKYFTERSNNWKNVYDASRTWMVPRRKNGKFAKHFIAKEYTNDFCESNAWQYFWFVPHDMQGLISTVGKTKFENKLDSMFTYDALTTDKLPLFSTGMIGQYVQGNEPCHSVAYLYNYLGKSWKGQKYLRQIMETYYDSTPNGLCGNDDYGQTSAWYIFSSLGFYPANPADQKYELGSPIFPKASIKLPNGNTFKVIAENASKENYYVQAVTLNGKKLDRTYITHKEITAGGTLHFVMGSKPKKNDPLI
ncbi:MAG: GH92 family glycosyl hydrolase [Cytophagales bacterium]|nr:GH92 family glycosyl hydrolase [Cytophagales bacterium]